MKQMGLDLPGRALAPLTAEHGPWLQLSVVPPITLVRQYLTPIQCHALQTEAQAYPFQQPEIQVFGQHHFIPRQQVWFADPGCDYLYSGLLIRGQPWPRYVDKLRQKLAREYGLVSNGVLVNHYRDGRDCMGAHSDDEPEIQPGSDIASISLGASRDFILKHKRTHERCVLTLHSGDLLVMHWPMQADWLHSVPKRAKVTEPRWNFTFRQLVVGFHARDARATD